jgi:hypothetical protein
VFSLCGRFSLRRAEGIEHDPEKWEPVFGKDHAPAKEHDPEKWEPVFGKDHAPKKPAPDLIRGRNRFSEKIMLQQNVMYAR